MPEPYKLASRANHPKDTLVTVGDCQFGGPYYEVIAGPCAVESKNQLMETAAFLSSRGVKIMRGGAFKPRTSPYEFQGLGLEALEYLAAAKKKYNLMILTEAMDVVSIKTVAKYADMIQIGSRNMQNFPLLKAAGKIGKPVLLKRGLSATIQEFILAAEYILKEGNRDVVLCERGVRSFNDYTRNMLDISAVPILKSLTHLPVIIDPSHAAGRTDLISPLSKAAAAVDAHGIIVEVHPAPHEALSDGAQSLSFEQFDDLRKDLQNTPLTIQARLKGMYAKP